ncbi:DUF5305 family protein [Natrialbaceae archaeon A-gly3]
MIDTGSAKLRYLIGTHGDTLRYVGVFLFVVGVVGVVATFAFPPTTAVTETTDRFVVDTQTSSSATVTENHTMYHAGETLTDEPVYLRSVTPTITLTVTTQAPPEEVTAEQRLTIVYEATDGDSVFRENRQELLTTSETITAENDEIESSTTVRIGEVANDLRAMRAEIGDAGTVTAFLAVETTYDSDGNSGTIEDRAQFTVSEDSYRVPTLSARDSHPITKTSTQPVADRVFQPQLPIAGAVVVPHMTLLFLTVATLGSSGVAVVRRLEPSIDLASETERLHQLRYEEWISGGDLPPTLATWTVVIPVESLEALVDVAIDSDTRVIHDRSQGCYAVMTGLTTYVFLTAADAADETTIEDAADGSLFDGSADSETTSETAGDPMTEDATDSEFVYSSNYSSDDTNPEQE